MAINGMTSRRVFLKATTLGGASILIAACSPQVVKETVVVEKVVKETVVQKEAVEVEKEVTRLVTAEAPIEAPAAKVELRFMERGDALGDFQRDASRLYEERNPHITIKHESTSWADLVAKVPTYYAADTMADLVFQHNTFMMPELGIKGAWLDLGPLAEKDGHDFGIYWPFIVNTLYQGPNGELIGLPMGIHNGDNEIMWNKELLDEIGEGEPSADMTVDEFSDLLERIQAKMPANGYAGYFRDHLYGMAAHARSFGGYIVSNDRQSTGLNLPETLDAHYWYIDLMQHRKVVPPISKILDSAKAMFYTGLIAVYSDCAANLWVGLEQATEGKITLGHCVWPHGGGGKVGDTPSCDGICIYHKSEHADEAWGLAKLLASFETSKKTALHESRMAPGAVIEAWHDPEVCELNPPYCNIAKYWDTIKPEDYGPIPVPLNGRRAEYWDIYNNEWAAMREGDKPFDQAAIDKLQADLQAVMDKPVA